MFSSPYLSKIDAAVIIVLLCGGAAALVESRHRILIVAPTDPEEVSLSTQSSGSLVASPTGEPTLAPTDAQPWAPAPLPERSSDNAE